MKSGEEIDFLRKRKERKAELVWKMEGHQTSEMKNGMTVNLGFLRDYLNPTHQNLKLTFFYIEYYI